MNKFIKGILGVCISSILLTSFPVHAAELVVSDTSVYQSSAETNMLNVEKRSPKEIQEYVRNHPATTSDMISYAYEPNYNAPYGAGQLSDSTLNSALNTLKQIRYIAGISDNITLDDSYNELSQSAAMVNYVNRQLSHYPGKPSGMDNDLYDKGYKGAGSSNISYASWNRSINETIVFGWMDDGDNSNIDRLGHRRWLINPKMGKTGFGAVNGKNGTFGAVYAFDRSNTKATESNVAWPAQYTPIEYFTNGMPWSVSTGDREMYSDIYVSVVKRDDGTTWNFSSSNADGYFNVNNQGYGEQGCVIFRPSDISIKENDVYDVSITGLVDGDLSYSVTFFSLASDKLTDEVEEDGTKGFVKRLYTVALSRNYDKDGLDDWVEKLTDGVQTGAEVARGFFFSNEFINKNLSDSDYVDTLYKTMFGREADESGKATWMKALSNGMSREYVYHGFAEGQEFKNLCDTYGIIQGNVVLTQNRDKNEQLTAFVARNYTKALGRAAEEAGINDWTGRILAGVATPADVTAGFIFSPEFANKGLSNEEFLKVLYQTYFDRDPDAAGFNGWMEQLNNGVSREYVVNTGFSCSQEFKNLVASFGL